MTMSTITYDLRPTEFHSPSPAHFIIADVDQRAFEVYWNVVFEDGGTDTKDGF
jgi:hypothetical protein